MSVMQDATSLKKKTLGSLLRPRLSPIYWMPTDGA